MSITETTMHLTGLGRVEVHFYGSIALGLVGLVYRKYHLFPGWNVQPFLKAHGHGILRACAAAFGMGYFLPDLALYASEKHEALAFVRQSPALAYRLLNVVGALLGFTGGTLGYDLLKLLYNVPVLGPVLEKGMNLLRDRLRNNP